MVFLSSIWLLYLLNKGISLFDAAFLEVGYSLTILFFEIPTGYIADRFGRKKSVIVGYCIESFAVVGFGLANTLPEFLASYIVWGIGTTFISGAIAAWLFDEIKFENSGDQKKAKKRFHYIYSIFVALGWVSSAIAETIGGVLASIRYEVPIFLTAIIWLIAAIVGLFIPEHQGSRKKEEITKETAIVSSNELELELEKPTLRIALQEFKRPEIVSVTTLMIILSSVGLSIAFFFPVYMAYLGVDLSLIGLYFAIGTASTATGNALSTRYFRKSEDKALILLILLETLAILSFVIGDMLWVGILAWAGFSHFRGAIMPYLTSELNGFLKSSTRATAISLTGTVQIIIALIFELSSAKIIEIYGFLKFFLALVLVMTILAFPFTVLFALKYSTTKITAKEYGELVKQKVDY